MDRNLRKTKLTFLIELFWIIISQVIIICFFMLLLLLFQVIIILEKIEMFLLGDGELAIQSSSFLT